MVGVAVLMRWVGLEVRWVGLTNSRCRVPQALNFLHPGFSFKGGSFLSGRSGDPSGGGDPLTPRAAPPRRGTRGELRFTFSVPTS